MAIALIAAFPLAICAAAATSVTISATACLGFDVGDYIVNQVERYFPCCY